MNFDALADAAFKLWGLHGTSLMVTLVLISMGAQLVARLIPDDATGWKRVVRLIAKTIGLYASNRITSGITATDVVKAAIHNRVVTEGQLARTEEEVPPEPLIPSQDELVLGPEDRAPIIPAFPGLQRPPETADFPPLKGDES